jgi:glutathione S-transferase
MSRIRLFGVRLSPFCEKIARALQLKGIEFELVAPSSPADFKRWNPQTGKMPVLEVDGERYFDSSFILEKLETLAPEPALFASDTETRSKQRFMEDWSDESFYWYVMAMRWVPENASASADQIAESFSPLLRPLVKLIVPRQIGPMPRAQGLGRLPLDVLVSELGRRLDELLCWLGDRPFMFADRIGAADLALFGQMNTLCSGPTPQGARLVDERAALRDYYDRIDRVSAPARSLRTSPAAERSRAAQS